MANRVVAKLFKHGGSQALRLPKEFRFKGDRVTLTKQGDKVVIEPEEFDVGAWLKEMRENAVPDFMFEGRDQPEMPPDGPNPFDE